MKKLIIVEHRARELANRLWNDISIHAYGLDSGAQVVNLTGLEHIRLGKYIHALLARCIDVVTRKSRAIWTTGSPKYLPPTIPTMGEYGACKTLYFFGWLFRNPVGLEKHRVHLLEKFAPKQSIVREIEKILVPHEGKTLIGVRIRQKSFAGFPNGEFLISQERAIEIAHEYLREQNIKPEQAAIIEVSDTGPYDEPVGFHMLSRCSVVIGDNSTYSNLAAWFGNVPHIVTTDEPIDWSYYRNRSTYFENKYATFTHGSSLYP